MKIVLSGSSNGIGRALAIHLLEAGHQIWGLARSEQAAPVEAYASHFKASRVDVSNWSGVESAATEVRASWGGLDAVIACAGLQGEVGPALACDPEKWSATVRVNLDGTFYLIRAFAPLLRSGEGHRKIICFSGGGATKARPNFSAYGVAKTAVVRLVETLAEEWRGQPIDINAIAPGAINTRLTDEVLALGPERVGTTEYQAALRQKENGGASLDRALGLVDYLLSQESNGVTGRLIAAPWDPWPSLHTRRKELEATDIFTLRRIVPEDRGHRWEP